MWALVKDGKVEETYDSPKCIVLDEVRYGIFCRTK